MEATATEQEVKNSPHSRRTAIASFGALGAVIAASSCSLPLLPFLAAAGTAGSSAFFVKVRPFLVAISVLLVAFGFYQSWKGKHCKRRPSRLNSILLWTSAVIVVASILFPQAIANLVADILAK